MSEFLSYNGLEYYTKDIIKDLKRLRKRLDLIAIGKSYMSLNVVSSTTNKPIPGLLVNGIKDENDANVMTNDNGFAEGYIATGSTTISISGYTDVNNFSKTYTIEPGQVYEETIQLQTINFRVYTSSTSVKFSKNVISVDVSTLGGGGAGGKSFNSGSSKSLICGGGGGGGYVTKNTVTIAPNTVYTLSVGSGGSVASSYDKPGNAGGTSSFLGVTANGGQGGYGLTSSGGSGNGAGGSGAKLNTYIENWAGAKGSNGSAGYQTVYSSFTDEMIVGGGGGGGSAYAVSSGTSGGSPGGGGGAYDTTEFGSSKWGYVVPSPVYGLGGGGGGGGATSTSTSSYTSHEGSPGSSGRVSFRMHLKSED